MEIKKIAEGISLTLKVSGRLETTTAPDLDEEIKNMEAAVKALRFDFTDLEYVSSAGLRVILTAQKTMNARSGRLELAGVNETVKRIFDITGFSPVLTFV